MVKRSAPIYVYYFGPLAGRFGTLHATHRSVHQLPKIVCVEVDYSVVQAART